MTQRPATLERIPDDAVVHVDVRDDLMKGQEPFGRIMEAAERVPDGGALTVRAIFEPVPLYRVMAGRGFGHWTEELGPRDWRVWFHRDAVGGPADPEEDATGGGTARKAGDTASPDSGDVRVLDVRGLEPPEPMTRTLEALETLPEGATLVQVNVRVPRFLLPHLSERGFTWDIREQEEEGVVRVFIRRATERVLDVRVIPPPEKHPTIFQTWEALEPGASFVLVNDHDPKPLRYQFQAEHEGAFEWEYLEEGPAVWRVRIGRTAGGTS